VAGNITGLRRLVWVDRRGREEDLGAPPDAYNYPRLSPNGSRVAVDLSAAGGNRDIYIWNIERKLLEQFTLDPAPDVVAQWNRDGTQLVWAKGGVPNLFIQSADRSGSPERLTESDHLQVPSGFAPDGRLLFGESVPNNGARDLMALSLDTRRVEPVIVTEALDGDGNVSPDGRWIAYISDESGRFEVYVRPYPKTDGGKSQVSTRGGKHPLWSRNGRELYYRAFDGAIVAVPVPAGPRFLPGEAVTILPANSSYTGAGPALDARRYDLSLDGKRFLMVKRVDDQSPRSMLVVQNWTEELKRLVPGK
jgi:serine/threonine-protein kinase